MLCGPGISNLGYFSGPADFNSNPANISEAAVGRGGVSETGGATQSGSSTLLIPSGEVAKLGGREGLYLKILKMEEMAERMRLRTAPVSGGRTSCGAIIIVVILAIAVGVMSSVAVAVEKKKVKKKFTREEQHGIYYIVKVTAVF